MTEREHQIYEIIKKSPAIEQSEIASMLGISRSSVAVHIANLQKKGYIMGKQYIINAEPYVVGIGAANIDICGKCDAPVIMHDSNPALIQMSPGGVTRNMCENLARMDVDVRLIAAVGDDVYGEKIRTSCAEVGIDTSAFLTVKGQPSSSYISMLDSDGEMVVSLCDMSIVDCYTPEFIRSKASLLNGAQLIATDSCLPPDIMEALLDTARVPVFFDPVSVGRAKTMIDFVGRFDTIKPNRMEAEVLSGVKITDDRTLELACDKLIEKGVHRVIVSLGSKGCFYKDCAGNRQMRSLRALEHMVNANGAGDTFMAAIIRRSIDGASIEDMLDFALAAGIMAVQSERTINPDISVLNIEKTRKEYEK